MSNIIFNQGLLTSFTDTKKSSLPIGSVNYVKYNNTGSGGYFSIKSSDTVFSNVLPPPGDIGTILAPNGLSTAPSYTTYLTLGNKDIPKEGRLRLVARTGGRIELLARSNTTTNTTFYLPGPTPAKGQTSISIYGVWRSSQEGAVGTTTNPAYVNSEGQLLATSGVVVTDGEQTFKGNKNFLNAIGCNTINFYQKTSDTATTLDTTYLAGSLTVSRNSSSAPSAINLILGNELNGSESRYNQYGTISLYNQSGGKATIEALSTTTNTTNFILPGYNGDTYAVWRASSATAVGTENIPIYLDQNGCIQACSTYLGTTELPWTNIYSKAFTVQNNDTISASSTTTITNFSIFYNSFGTRDTMKQLASIISNFTSSAKNITLSLGNSISGAYSVEGNIKLHGKNSANAVTIKPPNTSLLQADTAFILPGGVKNSSGTYITDYYSVWHNGDSIGSDVSGVYVDQDGQIQECSNLQSTFLKQCTDYATNNGTIAPDKRGLFFTTASSSQSPYSEDGVLLTIPWSGTSADKEVSSYGAQVWIDESNDRGMAVRCYYSGVWHDWKCMIRGYGGTSTSEPYWGTADPDNDLDYLVAGDVYFKILPDEE